MICPILLLPLESPVRMQLSVWQVDARFPTDISYNCCTTNEMV
jgi:hypothetical protein